MPKKREGMHTRSLDDTISPAVIAWPLPERGQQVRKQSEVGEKRREVEGWAGWAKPKGSRKYHYFLGPRYVLPSESDIGEAACTALEVRKDDVHWYMYPPFMEELPAGLEGRACVICRRELEMAHQDTELLNRRGWLAITDRPTRAYSAEAERERRAKRKES